MSEQLNEPVTVKAGRLIEVTNLRKHHKANKSYIAVQVEDSDGSNEKCLLFTKNEITRAEARALKNPEDVTTKNWLTDLLD